MALLARGVKNDKIKELIGCGDEDDDENPLPSERDFSKLLAEEQRRAQALKMENIVNGIHDLHEKSVIEKSNINGIKEIIKYKYPVQPSIGKEGADIYGKVLSKVNSTWGEGELSDMKIRSKSRQGSPCSRTIGRQNRQDSIYLEDFKKMRTLTLNVEKTRIESDCTNKTTNLVSNQALQSQRNKTTDRYSLGQGQGQGG